MSIGGFFRSYWHRFRANRLKRRLSLEPSTRSLDRPGWEESIKDPTGFYLDCVRYFCNQLPPAIREHRKYFDAPGKGLGFGEDAFHVMWFLLFKELKPASFLEIRVFRGQTISLAALLARTQGIPCEIHGISPFSPAADSVSKYPQGLDYYRDTLFNFDHFGLAHPKLLRAFSTDAEALALIKSRSWELVYIDGNHEYDVARRDWDACSASLKPGGCIVLDDAGVDTSFVPPVFATGGHPGPSRLAREIDPRQFAEILQVGHNRVFQKKT